jgi:hypothetical protein
VALVIYVSAVVFVIGGFRLVARVGMGLHRVISAGLMHDVWIMGHRLIIACLGHLVVFVFHGMAHVGPGLVMVVMFVVSVMLGGVLLFIHRCHS